MKPKTQRTEQWYRVRLSDYFNKHFLEYEDDITWFVDPAPNQWLFNIPEFETKFELTCDTAGNVTVMEYPMRGVEYQ